MIFSVKNKKTIEELIDNLAIMVSQGFDGVEKRFVDLEDGQKQIRKDILNTGDKYVTQFRFDELSLRVSKLEEKGRNKK